MNGVILGVVNARKSIPYDGRFGFSVPVVQDALRAGDSAQADTSPFEPTTAAGTTMWNKTVGAFRSALTGLGWHPLDVRNQPLCVHPDGSIAILISSGNQATGDYARTPSNRNPKGKQTQRHVANNQRSGSAFRHDPLPFSAEDEQALRLARLPRANRSVHLGPGVNVWILLYTKENGILRSEISLPITEAKGKIIEWEERLVITEIDLTGGDIIAGPTTPMAPPDITFSRRATGENPT